MSLEAQMPKTATSTETAAEAPVSVAATSAADLKNERAEKLLKAKELYSIGSRNFLIKSFTEAADELSHVCALYAEMHGELADELGMPYLLYAKCLIALSLDENKIVDVPDEEPLNDDDEDDDDDEEEDEDEAGANANESEAVPSKGNVEKAKAGTNGTHVAKLDTIKENAKNDEADSTADDVAKAQLSSKSKTGEKAAEDAQVSSTDDTKAAVAPMEVENSKEDAAASSTAVDANAGAAASIVLDDEKPSTSNGDAVGNDEEDEDNEAESNLQLAWEILEMAAKIFTRQGESGLPNLAEVQTELGNIQFENSILDAARDDYEKALQIYSEMSTQSYRRAMAEIHYKIGLAYLMQQLNKEGAISLKKACELIQAEIDDIKAKADLEDKDADNIQDMEETKQEIEAKISEIEEMQAQQIADVRAALDSYIKPLMSQSSDGAGPSSSSAAKSAATSATTSKPNDISHLIKRKKRDEPSSEAEAAASPAKRPTP